MPDCCSDVGCKTLHPKKQRCPINGKGYSEVTAKTIAHHIRDSWKWSGSAARYFFCDDPSCDVVYFGGDGTIIRKEQLRTRVSVKEAADDALVCYCFGATKADALSDPGIKDFVVTQTKQGLCSCDTRNPSGRCCLKDFPAKRNTE